MEKIKKTIRTAVEAEYPNHTFELNIFFCDDETIRSYNREYRGVDRATDVLSFPLLQDGIPTADDIDPETGRIPLGDIVISLDRAHAQAREYGHSFERELAFLCVHSVLHLLGYDHMEPDEAAVMEAKQAKALEDLGITR